MKSIRRSIVVLTALVAVGVTQPSVARSNISGHIQIGHGGHIQIGHGHSGHGIKKHHGHSGHGHSGHGIKKHHGHRGHVDIDRLQRFYHHPYGYRQHDRRPYRRHNKHRPKFSYGHRSYRNYRGSHTYGYSGSPYRRACHPVSKLVDGAYGHSKRIGGTMCYDRFGNGYVVPGSRRVIRY